MGWLYVVLTALSFGLLAFFSRFGTVKGGKPEGICLGIYSSAALVTLIICLAQGDITFSKELLLYGLISGIFGIAAYIFFSHALKIGHYGFSISFVSTSFLIPVIFSIIIWHEKLVPEGILLIVASTFLIAFSEEKKTPVNQKIWGKWLVFSILAFIFNGLCLISQAYSSSLPKEATFKFLFLNYIVGALVSLVLVLKKKEFTFVEMKYSFLAGLSSISGTYFTLYACMLLQKNIVFSVYCTLYMILGALISLLFFKEKLTKAGFWGILCGIAGIILVSFKITFF